MERLRTPVPSLLGKSKPQESREGGRGTENEYTAIKGKKKKKKDKQTKRDRRAVSFLNTGWLQRCLCCKVHKSFTEEIQADPLLLNKNQPNNSCYFCTLGNL